MSNIALGAPNAAAAGSPSGNRSGVARASGWYGVWLLVVTEGSLFAYLLFSYSCSLLQAGDAWPRSGPPSLTLASLGTSLLAGSSAALLWLQRGPAKNARLSTGLALALVLGAAFVGVQSYDFIANSATVAASASDSYYVLLSGLDLLHAGAGVVALAALLFWSMRGRVQDADDPNVSIVAIYWHFTVIVWLCIFATLYLLPRWR
ncbi:cytochrome c oxidase subunit III [Methylocella silvestris BL2]|uniref:Cytochrome c oxidase subunit III n=1 Tax=Methylocella silvestris (strain DSM 15510 / CIP 108128 / LMG 27833 / NCIMB 13906 / BL2) TaxID=395965 RepID=B8ES69_METSB|nr:cytochrome c oxidase subunit 3 [Methylocella silvestris]ACK52284.1 cytochrome c oxidase subunit III [Methylocella silvestris BL2]